MLSEVLALWPKLTTDWLVSLVLWLKLTTDWLVCLVLWLKLTTNWLVSLVLWLKLTTDWLSVLAVTGLLAIVYCNASGLQTMEEESSTTGDEKIEVFVAHLEHQQMI